MKSKPKRQTTEKEKGTLRHHFNERLREGSFIFSLLVSVFILIALISYHRSDPGWSHFSSAEMIKNSMGQAGAWVADCLLYTSGYMAFIFPLMLSYAAWLFYRYRKSADLSFRYHMVAMRTLGFLFIFISGTSLLGIYGPAAHAHLPFTAGGIIGYITSFACYKVFNQLGSTLILSAILLIGITLFTGFSWMRSVEGVGRFVDKLGARAGERLKLLFAMFKNGVSTVFLFPRKKNTDPMLSTAAGSLRLEPEFSTATAAVADLRSPMLKPAMPSRPSKPEINQKVVIEKIALKPRRRGELPPLNLLNEPQHEDIHHFTAQELEEKSHEVEARLADFNVEAPVVAVHPGPVVTRFELDLAAGTKVSKITALAKDLARSLSVVSVRVVEIIPGKSVIGLELPNPLREPVSLKELLASRTFEQARSILPLVLGKDIAGHPVVVDLYKMPHLLVAGTTGSGKSVGLNAMLLSLLYKFKPDELKLILIDPKLLELAVYDGIPHLLAPVVTDMKDAATALRWCVVEMERRYQLMAGLGGRNIAGFNQQVRDAKRMGMPIPHPLYKEEGASKTLEVLPQIVVLADEFADMMMVVGKKVETLITRLAQKARAAGIHLIFATQRPSVDVITGLIKANIPTRIAYQVSSKVDSRTILDQAGAEQLLGAGDLLYLSPGSSVPMRVHGAYVGDDEVHKVVKFLKQTGEPDYCEEVLNDTAQTDTSGYVGALLGEKSDTENDPLYDQAVEFVVHSQRISISSIQRRFKIGYNRAACLVEAMEAAGLVSAPAEGSGVREVLTPKRSDD